jgi:hypothetical protein
VCASFESRYDVNAAQVLAPGANERLLFVVASGRASIMQSFDDRLYRGVFCQAFRATNVRGIRVDGTTAQVVIDGYVEHSMAFMGGDDATADRSVVRDDATTWWFQLEVVNGTWMLVDFTTPEG